MEDDGPIENIRWSGRTVDVEEHFDWSEHWGGEEREIRIPEGTGREPFFIWNPGREVCITFFFILLLLFYYYFYRRISFGLSAIGACLFVYLHSPVNRAEASVLADSPIGRLVFTDARPRTRLIACVMNGEVVMGTAMEMEQISEREF